MASDYLPRHGGARRSFSGDAQPRKPLPLTGGSARVARRRQRLGELPVAHRIVWNHMDDAPIEPCGPNVILAAHGEVAEQGDRVVVGSIQAHRLIEQRPRLILLSAFGGNPSEHTVGMALLWVELDGPLRCRESRLDLAAIEKRLGVAAMRFGAAWRVLYVFGNRLKRALLFCRAPRLVQAPLRRGEVRPQP